MTATNHDPGDEHGYRERTVFPPRNFMEGGANGWRRVEPWRFDDTGERWMRFRDGKPTAEVRQVEGGAVWWRFPKQPGNDDVRWAATVQAAVDAVDRGDP